MTERAKVFLAHFDPDRHGLRQPGSIRGARIDLLLDRTRAGECDLVVKSGGDHGEKGYLYDVASGLFRGNRAFELLGMSIESPGSSSSGPPDMPGVRIPRR